MTSNSGNSNSGGDDRFSPRRRQLLAGIAASAAGAAALSACGSSPDNTSTGPAPTTVLPDPKDSGIDHIVVVMMENRSFDHYFGWLPGAEGRQAGLSFTDSAGNAHQTHALAPNFQNCDSADPDHSYEAGHADVNNGKMDGFLLPQPVGDLFPIGYYVADDLPFYKGVAANWTVCDHYFSGILSCTFPNRFYMHAGQTDRVTNTAAISSLPTIWDSLKAAGVTGRYYYSDVPFTALWGLKHLDISQPLAAFKLAAANGNLPSVSYIDPKSIGEGAGTSNDDHPLADVRSGQAFLSDIYAALRSSPQWDKTLLIINYDEWGGFFDHVEPPFGPVSDAEFAATKNDGRLGIRVPCCIIGPRARRGHVETLQFDPNSILNMIAWRFGFKSLGVRSGSTNLAHALDFGSSTPDTSAPDITMPAGDYGKSCNLQQAMTTGTSINDLDAVQRRQAEHLLDWQMVQTLAQRNGFPI
ncbi:MAG: hypothetical protein JWR07_2609 [Nevskia sp.]|nr:hypothetical protein [Nevskia sp.]